METEEVNKKDSNWLLQIKFIAASLKSRKISIWVLSLRHAASCCLSWAAGEAGGENLAASADCKKGCGDEDAG